LDPSEEAVGTSAVESDAQAEDRKLAAAILRKDRKATAEFVAKYADPIYRYVRSRLIPRIGPGGRSGSRSFPGGLGKPPELQVRSPLLSWLQGIARHKVKNQYRACLRAPLPLEEARQETSTVVMKTLTSFWTGGACSKEAEGTGNTSRAISSRPALALLGKAVYTGDGDADRQDGKSHREAPGACKRNVPRKVETMTSRIPEDEFFERVAVEASLYSQPATAPSKLKSQIYSALMQRQAASGPLSSLTQTKASGYGLCFFEELVHIAPAGERLKSLNICRVCHARVLAEHLEKAPIYWPNCPYVKVQGS
jgi:hypothetical protein